MSEISLLPVISITLTGNSPLVHVQPHISLLQETTLQLVPNALRAITPATWPASLPQYFLDDGNYSETPFPNVLTTPTDSGVSKSRKRFTGKFNVYSATVWLSNNTKLDTFRNFYYGEADQGNDEFTIPIPGSAGVKSVKFVPGSLLITSDGGVGWRANFQLIQQPEGI